MKKLLVMAMMVVIATGAFAAGQAEEETPDELVYLTPSWGAPSDELVNEFEEKTGIQLEVATVDIDTSRNRVLTAAAGRTNAADVIFVSADTYAAFQSAGAIAPLMDLASEELLATMTGLDQFMIGDELWAVPLYQQMVMIDYDTTALDEIGWTAEDIQTWDDFEEAMVLMKEQGLYEYPYAAGVRSWTWLLTALSSGSDYFDEDNNPVFDDPGDPAYAAFERVIGFFEKGLISPERLTEPNAHPQFWGGRAGFHQSWQGGLVIANDPERSEVAPNGNYLLLPEEHYTWLLPAGLTVSAYTDYPEAAMELIEFFTESGMQNYLFTANGLFPANEDVFRELGDSGAVDGWDVMQEQAQYIKSIPYDQPWYLEFQQEIEQTMLRVARGEQTTDAALKHLGDYARELKAEYE
ncbi:MAG: extracellular solute-binding protein [Spirochaetaceae bacterium]